ncbi:hypothetical protein SAMN04488697_12185 [Pseudomonas sp. 43mfcvi1.1]|nr:hypothetical protein ATJ40_12185 [Pseudomonas sp. 43mfcvi1.1]SSB99874.1 hypothetical protein SAMN04488697_12185 [Pseudomonas sp. 43mfcvi1.1]
MGIALVRNRQGKPDTGQAQTLWRGDLSPLGCEAALKPDTSVCQLG